MPPVSDDEYIQEVSDDGADNHVVTRGKKKLDEPRGNGARGGGGFEVTRTWESVVEGADGTISGSVQGLLDAGKKRRVLKDTTPLQRGIIRHLVVILDFSEAMVEKDMRPTRHRLTIRFAQEFVTEYFEQNPISQLGIIGMRDGLAVRVSDMSGNPNDHISSLQKWRDQDPTGQASLQNAMEMARGALFNAPSHGTREVLLVMGALVSADPGDIHSTITALVSAHITVRVIGLAAELAICRTLATRTNPNLNSTSTYHVARHEQHYRELIMDATTPPPTAAPSATSAATGTGADGQQNSLLMMGFPSRVVESAPSFCACHSKPSLGGYLCSRCRSKVCSLPTTCPACSLTLILSTHLARSYHHLFPLKNWAEVSWERAAKKPDQRECFSCLAVFPELEKQDTREERAQVVEQAKKKGMTKGNEKRDGGVSESGRYECETCKHFFCIDCDVFCHETVHNCPGCQSSEGRLMAEAQAAAHNGAMEGVEA